MQQPEAAGAKVQQRFDNLNYNDIKKGKQLNFLRVSCGKLERRRSFVRSGGTETPLFSKNANLTTYAEMFNISVSYFTHLFTQQFGVSPYKYLLNTRMSQAKYLLIETNMHINDIAETVGYDDPFYFSRIFKKHTGSSPSVYRKTCQMDITAKFGVNREG